ncbi:zinc finger protein 64 [Trichomycterus rosablanca]|uniref:zinc finger protein 64 n=1 Tax=Trichomycterus rosablanca TaxID=2290929 RepID=UPI002F354714
MASFSTDGVNHLLMEVSPDIHICGFCKQQYNNFEVFLAHKQNGCQLHMTDISVTNTEPAEFTLEEALQTCVSKAFKKTIKTQKTPSKKLKPSLAPKRHICSFSGCTFKTQYGQKDMERHMLTHTGERPFECELCHKRFSRRDKLNLHSRSHTGEKPHKCKHCPYAAADSSSLKKHLRVHYDERPFKCQICPYASRNSSQLTVHLRSHTGDAPFQCNECGAKFKINSDLKRHARVHSGEKPYACDLCEYRCAMKANLKSHARLRHGTYACAECDFRCAAKAALRAHSRQHAPAQPLRCARCPYSCASKGALNRHERVHSDERPYACHRCPFASKQRANLQVHVRKCHGEKVMERRSKGGEEPHNPAGSRYRVRLEAARAFRCNFCDASFVREDSLRSHKRQHNFSQERQRLEHGGGHSEPQNTSTTKTDEPDQVALTLTNGLVPSFESPQLKIIVAPPLVQESTFIRTAMDSQSSKPGTLLLSSESQNVVLNPVIQQVSLLTPVQHISQPAEGNLEHQTVLLTHIAASQENHLIQTNVSDTQNYITSPSTSENAFITGCSDLDSLHALIQQGGAEVTVVTEDHASIATPTSQDIHKQSAEGNEAEDGLVVTDVNMEPSGALLVHSVPLVSVQDQQVPIYQLSPHQIFSDTNIPDSSEN